MKWISVKDKFPKEGVLVLVYGRGANLNDKTVLIGRYMVGNKYSYSGFRVWVEFYERTCWAKGVTHWMRLPYKPKEDKYTFGKIGLSSLIIPLQNKVNKIKLDS